MNKYDGLVVHQSFDDEGIIEVVETGRVRSLHFGSNARQSSMHLDNPNQLETLYAKSMMALLLFTDKPSNVLMIGLGGGTITKYLLYHFPDCQIQVVEYRKTVLKVARSHFDLPITPRLHVKIGCGAEHVYQQSKVVEEKYDLMVIDAYSSEGMALEVSSELFFDNCRTLLKDDGMLAINLWGSNKALMQEVLWNIGGIYQWKILFLPVRKRGNIIGFAFREKTPIYSLKQLREKAKLLEKQHYLDYPLFVKDIKKNNPTTLDKVLKK